MSRARQLTPRHDPSVRHRVRPLHKRWHPMHITLRAIGGLASFRRERLLRAFQNAVKRTRQPGFRIVELSVQTNHVHLLVEADNNEALTRGMRSFTAHLAPPHRLRRAASPASSGAVRSAPRRSARRRCRARVV